MKERGSSDWLGLEGRVAVITGGGQGLGREFARSFAAQGALPVIVDINAENAKRVAAEIEAEGGRALAVPTDVAEYDSVAAMVDTVVRVFDRIDILVNAAAIFSNLKKRGFDEIPLDEWDRVMRVNITGVFNCCRAVVPVMRRAKWGRIVNVSSNTVVTGRPGYLHYTTSKAALIGLSRSLGREVGVDGITVNTLMPGATETEIPRETVTAEQRAAIVKSQSIPRPETPEDLANVVLLMCSAPAGFVTGQSVVADGGLAHL